MARATLDDGTAWAARALRAAGTPPEVAQCVARALVAAEADGLSGHGLARLPTYCGMVRSGKVNAIAVPTATWPRPGVLAIDAERGFAYPAIEIALKELPAAARAQGIALAAIRRSGHAGAIGHHVERLAEAGLVALMLANTPEAIAPWGGSRAVFGTNPIGFAAPLSGRPPVVVDLALSKVARGSVVAARAASR